MGGLFSSLSTPASADFPPVNARRTPITQDLDVSDDILGTGVFSVVRPATDKKTGERLAVKIIDRKQRIARAEARFHNEFRLWAACQHPNIVGFRQLYATPHYYSVAMTLADGGELFDQIVAHERFCERLAARCIREILCGLAYLHERGVIHRDIKPENLLLDSRHFALDGSRALRVLICDFGIATRAPQPPQLLTEVSGSPGYMAPELLVRSGYSRPVDLFSAGVSLYIMLCGSQPFSDGDTSPRTIARRTTMQPLDFASPPWPSLSPHARHIVAGLLEKDPAARLTAAQALDHPWLADVDSLPGAVAPDQPAVPETPRRRLTLSRLPEVDEISRLPELPHSASNAADLAL